MGTTASQTCTARETPRSQICKLFGNVYGPQPTDAYLAHLSNVSVSFGALCSQSICQLTGQDVAQLHFEPTELTGYPSLQYKTSQTVNAQSV